MYHVHHTEALILGSRSVAEADRLLYCYTKEHGLVAARAKSVRESRSKLKYALQNFTHAEIDLIEGKYGWRLISARPVHTFRETLRHPLRRRAVAGYGALVRRLIQGEERHQDLFSEMISALEFLGDTPEKDLGSAEAILIARLLHRLGYWGEGQGFGELMPPTPIGSELLRSRRPDERSLTIVINEALKETQL